MKKFRNIGKKLIVYLLTLAMLFTLAPASAFAEEETGEAVTSEAVISEAETGESETGESETGEAVTGENETEICTVTYHANGGYLLDYYDDKKNEYAIEFEYGSILSDYPYSVYHEDETRTFLGWFNAQEGGTRYDFSENEYIVTENMDLWAQWSEVYTVTYHANGGYLYNEDGEEVEDFTKLYEDGAILSHYLPHHNNSTTLFQGWFDAQEGGTQYDFSENEYVVTGDMDLWAQWEDISSTPIELDQTIVFASDGKEIYHSFIPETDGYYTFLIENDYSEENYHLDATLYSHEFVTLESVGTSEASFTITSYLQAGSTYYLGISFFEFFSGKITVTTERTINVTYHTEEGTYILIDGEKLQTYTKEEPADTWFIPSLWIMSDTEDKSFIGWKSSDDEEVEEGKEFSFSEDADLYAVWGEECTVTYHANSGINAGAYFETGYYDSNTWEWIEERTETYQSSAFKGYYLDSNGFSPCNDMEEWSFMGWSTDPSAETPDESIMVTGDIDVYAVWEDNYLSITFDANGGYLLDDAGNKVSSKAISCYRGDGFSVPDTVYNEDTLQIFKGWYTEKEGGTQIGSWDLYPEEDTTLYAHWNKRIVTPVELDVPAAIVSDSGEVYISFTPVEPGLYRFRIEDDAYYHMTAYDQQFEHEGGTWGYSLSINREIAAGETVYYGIENGDDEEAGFECTITVTAVKSVTVTYHTDREGTYFEEDGKQVQSLKRLNRKYYELEDYPVPESKDESLSFAGWARTPDAENEENITAMKDIDVYAVWKKAYKVTYHANGEEAYFYTDWEYDEDGNETEVLIQERSEWVPEGEPVSDYFGWSLNNKDSSVVSAGWASTADADTPENDLTAVKDMDVYAVWTKPCTVTFDLNIDTDIAYYREWDEDDNEIIVSSRTVTLTKGSEITMDMYWPYINDSWSYQFLGWSTDPEATWRDEPLTVSDGLKVYGVWYDRYVDVTFDANGGYFDDKETTRVTQRSWTGDRFYGHYVNHENKFAYCLGWYDAAEGGNRYKEGQQRLPEDVTLYAHWQIREPKEITLNTGTETAAAGGEDLYSFVPDETTVYRIYTYDKGEYEDPYLRLYSSDMEEISSNFGGRGGVNAAIESELKAGETYYIGTSLEEKGAFSFGVIIRKLEQEKVYTISYHVNQDPAKAYFTDAEGKAVETYTEKCNEGWKQLRYFYDNTSWFTVPVIADGSLYFAGWSLEKDAADIDPDFYDFDVTEDTDLYAVWKTACQVTLHANRDEEGDAYYYDSETDTRSAEKTVALLEGDVIGSEYEPALSTSDYKASVYFAGWSTDPDAAEPDEDLTITGKTDLYAVWKDRIKVTFHIGQENAYFDWWASDQGRSDELEIWFAPGSTIYSSYGVWADYYENLDDTVAYAGLSAVPNGTVEEYLEITEDVTDVYLIWYPKYTVTYNVNAAKNPKAYYRIYDEDAEEYLPDSETYTEKYRKGVSVGGRPYDDPGEGVNPCNEDEGLKIAGWSVDPAAEEPDGSITLEGDVTLYAVWKPVYTVQFIANDENAKFRVYDSETGSYQYVSDYSVQYLEGETFLEWEINDLKYTVEDKLQIGWSTDPEAEEGINKFEVTGNMKVYGVWLQAYPITYHANSPTAYFADYESIEETRESVVAYGNGYYEYWPHPTGLTQTDPNLVVRFSSTDPEAKEPDADTLITGPTDRYYIWGRIIDIIFDANGGYFDGNDTQISIRAVEDEVIRGYWGSVYHSDENLVFEGWFTEKEGGEYVPGRVAASEGLTVYAHWSSDKAGKCGDNAYWKLTETAEGSGEYTLSITGTGEIYNYIGSLAQNYTSAAPWFKYADSITSVEIAEGITRIGEFAFVKLEKVTEFDIPESVYSIGGYSFIACSGLKEITIPKEVRNIGYYAFTSSSLKEIRFEGNAPAFAEAAFMGVTADAYYPGGNKTWTEDVMQDYEGEITWIAMQSTPDLTLSASTNGVGITWTDVGAEKYRLQRKIGTGSWAALKTVNDPEYTDDDVSMGETYAYKVQAYRNGAWDEFSEEKSLLFNPFTDVPSSGKTLTYVSWAYNEGIVKGISETEFGPDSGCTRIQFVMMLWKMNGSPVVKGKNPFSDISGTKTTNAILWALDEGIINSGKKFNPSGNISRVQIVMMLWKMAGNPKVTISNPFTDVSGSKTTSAVLWAYKNGITKGTSETTFSPETPCTRLQLVIFLYKYNNL